MNKIKYKILKYIYIYIDLAHRILTINYIFYYKDQWDPGWLVTHFYTTRQLTATPWDLCWLLSWKQLVGQSLKEQRWNGPSSSQRLKLRGFICNVESTILQFRGLCRNNFIFLYLFVSFQSKYTFLKTL